MNRRKLMFGAAALVAAPLPAAALPARVLDKIAPRQLTLEEAVLVLRDDWIARGCPAIYYNPERGNKIAALVESLHDDL